MTIHSNQHAAYQQEKCHAYSGEMHSYTEKIFFTTYTIHRADNKNIWTLSSFLKLFFGQNPPGTDWWAWMTFLYYECILKGMGTYKCSMRLSRLALGWSAQCIALGKQCQAVSSHAAGAPQQDTCLVYSLTLPWSTPLHYLVPRVELKALLPSWLRVTL